MAIENPRPEKVAVVDEVRERLSSATATLLTEYRGLKVEELAELRQSVRAAGGDYKIYKNTLVRLAVADLGLEGLDDLLVGPTGVAFVDGDAVLVAKALKEFAKTAPNLVVKGGVLGRTALSAADAGSLADVAPREVVLAQLAGAFAAPLRQFAGLLAALPRNLAYGLAALIDQRGGPEAPSDEAAPAPEASEAPTDTPADEAEAPAPAAEAPEAPASEAPEAPAEAPEAPASEAPASEAPAPEAPAAAAAETPEAPAPEAPAPEADVPAAEAPEAVSPASSSGDAPEAVVPVQRAERSDVPATDAPAASAQPTTESPDGTESADKEQ